MKGRYQDNLEFLQWIKRYFDVHSPSETYDAKARREAAIAASKSNQRNVQNRAPIVPKVAQLATSKPRATAATPRVGGGAENGAISTLRSAARVTTTLAPTSAVANATTTTTSAARRGSPSSATTARLERQVNELKNDIADLQATVDALEKERNIYFNKLRGVEGKLTNAVQGSVPYLFIVSTLRQCCVRRWKRSIPTSSNRSSIDSTATNRRTSSCKYE